ncbi:MULTISPECIES: hypothetical protein [Zobellia]|uniref:hypothetical protein n=1 Tax=Zobellia TaxID=112040 RepID=UPI00188D4BB3|nr:MULTISPECIES: hypothetical protein [Zobellia]
MKYFLGTVLIIFMFSCSNDGAIRNPYLQELGFRFDMNLNLPLYSGLTNLGSVVYIDNAGIGNRGVYVIKSGFDQLRAFEASCPNHIPNECSTMTLEGQNVTCSCEDYEYSLFTGQLLNRPDDGNRYYDMLEYRATQSGNVVIISN